jgi:uncharacterized protein (DUF952 family)
LKRRRRADTVAPGQDSVTTFLYKICPAALWHEAERDGRLAGNPVDLRDGYIHFSTAEQVAETAARHFAGQADLVLLIVEVRAVADRLKWEVSRGGQLFPHLYAALPVDAVRRVEELRLGPDGRHVFPDLAS